MTTIIFYNATLRDVVAPDRTLTVMAGRGGDPERFWLSDGVKSVYLDPPQAAQFLSALSKMNRCVQAGKLADRSFYSYDIQSFDGHTLGCDMGIKVGRPYIALESTRIDVWPDDLAFFAAACRSVHYLVGGIGPASHVARTPPGPQVQRLARPVWEGFASRFCNNGEKCWYED